MEKNYYIRAESRMTGKRMRITGNMTEADAKVWQSSSMDRKNFRYFRYVRDKKYIKPGDTFNI